MVSWPRQYGGREASLLEWLVFEEEYHAAAAPVRVGQNGLFLLAPTLFTHGTAEQRDRLLPPMARAEEIWAQAWSEPDAGSDLAAIRASAVRAEGGWLLSGTKTWSSRAVFADRAFGLFRTDPAAERHRGLTYFLVDLRSPGVEVRGFERLDGDEGFADVFFDGAFVPERDVLGEVNRGWPVAMATTGSERGLTLRSPSRFVTAANRLVELARSGSLDSAGLDSPGLDSAGMDSAGLDSAGLDSGVRDRVVQSWIEARAYHLFTLEQVTGIVAGNSPGARSSLNKLYWSELDVRLHETAMELLGADAEADGPWSRGFEFSLAGPIYAGTNEIQRNIVAERLLGLPRA